MRPRVPIFNVDEQREAHEETLGDITRVLYAFLIIVFVQTLQLSTILHSSWECQLSRV